MIDEKMLLATVAPMAQERVSRLSFAIYCLSNGASLKDTRRLMVERFSISRKHAWCIVDMARDMAEE